MFSQPPDRKKSGGFFYIKKIISKIFCCQEHFVFLTLGYQWRGIIALLRVHFKSTAVNVERFVSLARRYTDIRELTPEILRTFISKIVIHERPSRKKNEGEQRIDIYFTHIGSMPDSESERADHCRDKDISARTAEFLDAHQKPISPIWA